MSRRRGGKYNIDQSWTAKYDFSGNERIEEMVRRAEAEELSYGYYMAKNYHRKDVKP